MTDRPIIFSAQMVRALLFGSKTQTRRIIKDQPGELDKPFMIDDGSWHTVDRLWVRENIRGEHEVEISRYFYAADNERVRSGCRAEAAWLESYPRKLIPSIHMPRWASRLTLIVEGVRVERLHDISENDACAEGVETTEFWCEDHPPSICFSVLWDSINSSRAPWSSNPWIVALTFRVIKANIDAVKEAA